MKVQNLQTGGDAPRVRFQLEYDPAEIALQRTPFGVRIALPDHHPSGTAGGPAFPAKVIRVVLPAFTKAERIGVEVKAKQQIASGPLLVAPLQKPQPGAKARKPKKTDKSSSGGKEQKTKDSTTPETQHFVADPKQTAALETRMQKRCEKINPRDLLERKFESVEPFPVPPVELPLVELYQTVMKAPEPVARIVRTEQAGPNSIALIEVKPVQYDQKGNLVLITSFEVSVYCQTLDGKTADQLAVNKAFFRSGVQAAKITDELKLQVINPVDLIDWGTVIPWFFDYDYIVITDNYAWNANTMVRGGFIGDQVAEYQRLVAWKRRRGLKARVVTITEITSGIFGNHTSGARDLQEVIRNFLKWALHQWNLSWVLLGGDVNVVPVRNAPGASEGHIGVQTANNPPDNNQSFWTGTFLKMKVVNPGTWWPGSWDHQLVHGTTGELIPYDLSGTSGPTTPGWYYCTDDTYTTRTTMTTSFVRVNGPAALVNATLQWLYEWNTIPTDFYYSSLEGPNYNLPGRHDWDLLNNGIYGQHTGDVDLDGVHYFADVSVGRAPTASAAQAAAFVSKVIAYEQFRDPGGSSLDTTWLHRMALVSSNWGGRWGIFNDANFPPADFRFHHTAGAANTLIKLPDADFTLDFNYNLLAVISDSDIRVLPYNDAGGRGWYYAKGSNNLNPSGILFNLVFFQYFFPIPTPWIVVRGAAAELTPQYYILDRGDADGSMVDQEELRRQIDTDLPLISEFTRLYEDEVDLSPADRAAAPVAVLTTPALQSAVNLGQHFLSLSGHGNSGGCCGFSSGVVNASNNGYQTFIAFADSCLTNQFDANDAVSEVSLFHPNGGAVAYIGNSRFSWIGVGDNFQRAFFHRMTTTRHLGHLNDTRVGMVDEWTGFWRLYNKWVIFAQNLMGDPEMPVWTTTPLHILADIPAEWDIRVPLHIHTRYRLIFIELNLSGVAVHIQQNTATRLGITNVNGIATLDLTGFHGGPAELTLSKIGYRPIIATINLLEPSWVKGMVQYIHHQEASSTTSEIGLLLGSGETLFTRPFTARKDLPDYAIILDAATDAFVSGKPISFFVNSNRDHGVIERFRFDAEPS